MRKLYFGFLSCLLVGSLAACNSESSTKVEDGEVEVQAPEEVNENEENEAGIDHHHELPYEWAATYKLEVGNYTLIFNKNEYGDESFMLGFVLEDSNITDIDHHMAHIMGEEVELNDGEDFKAKHEYANNLKLNTEGSTTYTFTVAEPGNYRIFTEHYAEEFSMQILNESGEEIIAENPIEYESHGHDHDHNDDHDHDHN